MATTDARMDQVLLTQTTSLQHQELALSASELSASDMEVQHTTEESSDEFSATGDASAFSSEKADFITVSHILQRTNS